LCGYNLLRSNFGKGWADVAKANKKTRKMTTNDALEQLFGKKAAKRLRKIAKQLTGADRKASKKKKEAKKAAKKAAPKKVAPKKSSSPPDRPAGISRTPVEGE